MMYPNNIKKEYHKRENTIYGNRGMDLEGLINETNNYYIDKDLALIYKKPTPIGVLDVSYENHKKMIKKAYFKSQSTLDYNGVYKGLYVDFEAKETKNRTSFPLNNIHPHQINHIRNVIRHKGITFLIILINNIVYLLKGSDFLDYIDNTTRKSIPYEYIKEKGYEIKYGYNPALDYLSIIDKVYINKKEENYE